MEKKRWTIWQFITCYRCIAMAMELSNCHKSCLKHRLLFKNFVIENKKQDVFNHFKTIMMFLDFWMLLFIVVLLVFFTKYASQPPFEQFKNGLIIKGCDFSILINQLYDRYHKKAFIILQWQFKREKEIYIVIRSTNPLRNL